MAISTAVNQSARASGLGIGVKFQNLRPGTTLLPQRIAVIGQGATAATYSTDKFTATSAVDVASAVGFGSPLHLAAQQLLPANGDGVGTIPVTFYPLVDDGSAAPSVGDITPAGSQTVQASYTVVINDIASEAFLISVGDSVADIVTAMTAAINANVDMPMIAVDNTTDVALTSKWEGTSANDLTLSVEGSLTAGTTFAFTQPVGGLVNPDVTVALDQVGEIWETIFVNCLEIADTTTLDLYETFNEGRWGALVSMPGVYLTGNNESTVATAITVTDARKEDRTNVQLVGVGSPNLPFVVAARQAVSIAVVADSNPAQDYNSQQVKGITPGSDGEQWDYADRDLALKGGSSGVVKRDGVLRIKDVVTMYHPSGDPTPAYQYVNNLMKLFTIIFNTDLIFDVPAWDGAPLIPDDQATTNPTAKKPSMAVAEIARMIDSLGLQAIISDPTTAKKSILAEINGSNPRRLDISYTVQLSGNSSIISIDLNFGFFFGS